MTEVTSNPNEFLWVTKYRPKTIEECILPESLKSTFQNIADGDRIPSLLLSGGPGVGKTTVAKALCDQVGAEWILINGSEDNGIDVLRTKIRNFASTMSLEEKKKVVIIDEADYLNCFAGTQKIKIINSDGKIEDVALEQMKDQEITVLSYSGTEVIEDSAYVFESGEKEVFEVEFEDGSKMICTEDHPFFSDSMGEQYIDVGESLKHISNIEINNFINKNGRLHISSNS